MSEQENADRVHADAVQASKDAVQASKDAVQASRDSGSDRTTTAHLITAIDDFTDEVKAAREELKNEREKRRTITRIIALFVAIALMLAVWNFTLYQEIREDRANDNLERCVNYNNLAGGMNKAMGILVAAFVAASQNPERTQELGDRFLEDIARDFPEKTCDQFGAS